MKVINNFQPKPSAMKTPVALCCTLLVFCQLSWSQDNDYLSSLNHFTAPVETEIEFKFENGLPEETRIVLRQWDSLDFLFKIDTTIKAGTKVLAISLFLEKPLLLQLELNKKRDQLFALPGESMTVNYGQLSEDKLEKKIENKPELQAINNYYENQFKLLGREIIQRAYQKYTQLESLEEVALAYDSLSQVQYDLLDQFEEDLPSWFVKYEKKNIEYTGISFKLYTVSTQRHTGTFSGVLPAEYVEIINKFDTEDEIALFSHFYVLSLNDAAYLKYCSDDCYGEDVDVKLINLRMAGLAFGQEIKNEKVRQVYFALNLMLMYASGHPYSEALLSKYAEHLSEPYHNRIKKHRPSSLTGQKAPGFYLKDMNGDPYTLNDLSGKVVLLNFWFVGCTPCIQEIEHEKKLTQTLKDQAFLLVNICTNSAEAAWRATVNREKMPGLNLYAKGNWSQKMEQAYQIVGYPNYCLIDKNGIIVQDKCPRPSSSGLIPKILEQLE